MRGGAGGKMISTNLLIISQDNPGNNRCISGKSREKFCWVEIWDKMYRVAV